MKKLIAVFLCIVMVVSYSCFGVFAAGDDFEASAEDVFNYISLAVSPSVSSTSAYSEVSVDLSIDCNPGFSVMILNLDYGSENIALKSVECKVNGVSAEFSNQSGASTLAFYHLDSDCTEVGTLATLTLSIGAFSGDAQIVVSAEEGNICNNDAQPIDAEFISGVIHVSCNHTYIYEGRTEPSCSKEGEIRYICTICNAVKTTPIDKTAHVARGGEETVEEADCDTEGVMAQVCLYCSQPIEGTIRKTPALGHDYEGKEFIVTKEPTCTEDGSHYRNCNTCGYKYVEAIKALGHDNGSWRTTYPADCVNVGVASRYCDRCDFVLETKETPLGEHFMDWAVTKEPTCSEVGLKEYLCVVCGEEKSGSETIPALGHTAADEIIVREPTCSENGLAETRCEDCNHLISSREIEKTPHIKNSLTVITAPTSENEGAGEYRCKVCDEVVESVIIPVTNGVIYTETIPTLASKATTVKVFIKNNPGFSVGVVRIKYDVASLIFDGITTDNINADITVGTPAAGEIAVLISLPNALYTEDGLIFSLNFTLTRNASDCGLELFYDAQNDFSAENGDRVFFNMESGEIPILTFVRGDVDGDGNINTSDLAALKLYLAGASETVSEGADVDKSGVINTGDLASLKLHLAGVPQF